MEGRQPARSIAIGHGRIGFLLEDFPWSQPARPDEAQLSTASVARGLSRALSAAGEVVPYLGPRRMTDPEAAGAMARHLEQVDMVWGEAYAGAGTELALRVRQEKGIDRPVVILAGGAVPGGLEAMLLPWQDLLRPGDGIAFTCAADLEIWRRLTDERAMVEAIVPLTLDESAFRAPDLIDRPAVRRRHGLPADAPLVLFVGPLNVQKNLHGLLHLLAGIRRRVRTAHLVLIGLEDDRAFAEFHVRNTGYVAWLRRLAADLDLEHAVTILGPLPAAESSELYACADLLIDLGFSHRENFGLGLARGLACGTPVVCTDWGSFRDIVPHDTGGYRVDTVLTSHGVRVDLATAAERVTEILAHPALRARLGRGAAAWAASHFTQEAAGRAIATLVNRLFDTRRPQAGAAYKPSELAFRYELHKRASGWYRGLGTLRDANPAALPWRPLFQGADYQIYLDLLSGHATRIASHTDSEAAEDDAISNLGPFVKLDHDRWLAFDDDPVWPHRRFCDRVSWAVLSSVEGGATIAGIAEATGLDPRLVRKTLLQLKADGFVQWARRERG